MLMKAKTARNENFTNFNSLAWEPNAAAKVSKNNFYRLPALELGN